MSEVEGVKSADCDLNESGEAPPIVTKMVAPTLRVEELRDDDQSPAYVTSEEEGATVSDLPAFHPPEDELKEKIIKQVEFYFSDANILKDAFLLKHVRRNKLGYVSLKLITSFKKVKSLTKDYRAVAYSLRQSDKLEVNEEGTKVRRKEPLPDHDETTPSRTVVAVNLPMENPTIENVAELFSKSGDIALIRVLRPGKPIPQDVKRHSGKHPEIGNTVCALVEFETHEAAKNACDSLNNEEDWRRGMRVVLLSTKREMKNKTDTKKDRVRNDKCKTDNHADGLQKSEADLEKSPGDQDGDKNGNKTGDKKRRRRGGKRRNSRLEEVKTGDPHSSSASGSEGECCEHPQSPGVGRPNSGSHARNSLSPCPDPHHLTPGNSPRSSPHSSPRSSPKGSPTMRRRGGAHGRSPLASEMNMGLNTSPRHSPRASPETRRRNDSTSELSTSPSSPWVQRRLRAQQEAGIVISPRSSPLLGRHMAGMEGILRQPLGPDGSRGFHTCKGRGKPIGTSELVVAS